MNAEVLKAGKSSCALSQPCEGECGTNLQSNKKLTKQFQACAKEVHGKLLSDGVGVDKGTEHELALIGCPVTDCGGSACWTLFKSLHFPIGGRLDVPYRPTRVRTQSAAAQL